MIKKIDYSKLETVTSENLFVDKQLTTIDENGLISQRIFGPIKSYKCPCGLLSPAFKNNNTIKRCEVCGVEYTNNIARYTTFGKIVLPFPVYKNTYNNVSLLKKIIKKNHYFILNPTQYDMSSISPCYISLVSSDKINIIDEYNKDTCLPIEITGLFTLYICLYYLYKKYDNKNLELIINNVFTYELLCIPPKCRNIQIQPSSNKKEVIAGELNKDGYIKILRLCKYDQKRFGNETGKTLSKYYYDIIEKNIGIEIPYTDDKLKKIDKAVSRYQFYTNYIYELCIKAVSHKDGHIRNTILSKSIDFTSRAHIIINPTLKAYEVTIPVITFMRLWFLEYLRFLFHIKNIELKIILSYINNSDKIEKDYFNYKDEFIEWFFKNSTLFERICLINRVPTLTTYGMNCVEIINVNNGEFFEVSPLILEQMAGDCDGDQMTIFKLHDKKAREEIYYNTSPMLNTIYNFNGKFLHTMRKECLYISCVMLSSSINEDLDSIYIDKLENLPLDWKYFINFETPVKINGLIYPYGLCLFNKYCGLSDIILKEFTNTDIISKTIYNDSKTNEEYHLRISNLSKKLFYTVSVHPKHSITVNTNEIINMNIDEEQQLSHKLPENPIVGKHIQSALTKKIYSKLHEDTSIYSLNKSGLIKKNIERMFSSIGYIADSNNIVSSVPIPSTIINGLSKDMFFLSSYGTRNGIYKKSKSTPDSGYLERQMVLNLSPIEICDNDCNTDKTFDIIIQSKQHINSLLYRWYLDNNELKLITDKNSLKVGDVIKLRSPITCKSKDLKICNTCFGKYNNIRSKYVGILSGQCISERLTQLSMSSFHDSGSCNLSVDNTIVDYIGKYLVDIINYDEKRFILEFNTIEKCDKLLCLDGFINSKIHNGKTYILYNNIYNIRDNDVSLNIKNMDELLKKKNMENILDVYDTYYKFINNITSVSSVYSIFTEIILCNMFITNNDIIFRYDDNPTSLKKKLGIKRLHTLNSKLLGLLFEANNRSISSLTCDNEIKFSSDTIYEKLFNEF